ncbi:hypothetical protein DV737_g5284, partial [Chaetothyriales sp. CBS 132003]
MTKHPPPNLTAPLTPSHRTLLLKHARSTVLLAVLPSTPLLDVKHNLLAALASRGLTTFPGSDSTTGRPLRLPFDDPAAIEFGVLVDRKDASRGWRLLREDEQSGSVVTSGTGKARRNGKASSDTATVDAAGLINGSWNVVIATFEEADAAAAAREAAAEGDSEGEDSINNIPIPMPFRPVS